MYTSLYFTKYPATSDQTDFFQIHDNRLGKNGYLECISFPFCTANPKVALLDFNAFIFCDATFIDNCGTYDHY